MVEMDQEGKSRPSLEETSMASLLVKEYDLFREIESFGTVY